MHDDLEDSLSKLPPLGDSGIRNELRIARIIAPENTISKVIPGFGDWSKEYETFRDDKSGTIGYFPVPYENDELDLGVAFVQSENIIGLYDPRDYEIVDSMRLINELRWNIIEIECSDQILLQTIVKKAVDFNIRVAPATLYKITSTIIRNYAKEKFSRIDEEKFLREAGIPKWDAPDSQE